MVLAESQPLTDKQIQCTLLREMAGLSSSALDADSEPCSPTRLLHNIERQVGGRPDACDTECRCVYAYNGCRSRLQSAQLNQIVNSLMSPLGFSPPSKQPGTCAADKAAFARSANARSQFAASNVNLAAAMAICAVHVGDAVQMPGECHF